MASIDTTERKALGKATITPEDRLLIGRSEAAQNAFHKQAISRLPRCEQTHLSASNRSQSFDPYGRLETIFACRSSSARRRLKKSLHSAEISAKGALTGSALPILISGFVTMRPTHCLDQFFLPCVVGRVSVYSFPFENMEQTNCKSELVESRFDR